MWMSRLGRRRGRVSAVLGVIGLLGVGALAVWPAHQNLVISVVALHSGMAGLLVDEAQTRACRCLRQLNSLHHRPGSRIHGMCSVDCRNEGAPRLLVNGDRLRQVWHSDRA